jgi:hypothetical protein
LPVRHGRRESVERLTLTQVGADFLLADGYGNVVARII